MSHPAESATPKSRKSTPLADANGPILPMPVSFEAAVAELDALVSKVESGQMPLAEMLGSYRRGASLLAHCRAQLQAVEDQVKVLEDGEFKPLRPVAG